MSSTQIKPSESETRKEPESPRVNFWQGLVRRLTSIEIIAPLIVGVLFLVSWELFVRWSNTPPYLLPGPLLVIQTLWRDWAILLPALWITLQITLVAFVAAIVSGVVLSILLTLNKWVEYSLFPYAVVLQTTPIVAIAPLIIIWTRQVLPPQSSTFAALVICAWIIAFFPILSNTTLGLNSVDHTLKDVFQLYNASPWQTLLYLRLPSALPYFLGGLRISGGLALIGAVVAEFVAGTGGQRSGIAYQILMASYNLQIARMFAAILLITLLGIAIFWGLTVLSNLLLGHWHESALKREN
ncbi:ABC transporter permease [Spirulina subsalsa]|uniref:ABC transporter permease n=1 Tax=Spirulina subsalsa TaxID=54311 RepID=UPI0002F12843|nr:ABC transporter permease [Spirulina subsalsa]